MTAPMPALIRNAKTGRLLRFRSRAEAAAYFGSTPKTISRLIEIHDGCPSMVAAAKKLGVSYTTLYRHIRAGRAEILLALAMRAAA